MPSLIIGPNLKRALFDPDSFFWRRPANYDLAPVAFQDAQGRFIAGNISFTNMARRPAREIFGKLPADLFDQEVATAIEDCRAQSRHSRLRATSQFWQTFGHGPRLYVDCHHAPVYDQQGLAGFLSIYKGGMDPYQWSQSLRDTLHVLHHDLQSPLSATLFFLQEQIRPACPPAASALLGGADSLCKQLQDTIRTCFKLSTHDGIAPPLRGAWLDPQAWAGHMARLIRRRYGHSVRWQADCSCAEAFLWSPLHLSHLFFSVIQIMLDSASTGMTAGTSLNLTMVSSIQEHLMTLAFPASRIDPHALDILLSSQLALLTAKAHGVHIQASSDSQTVHFTLHLPRVEAVPQTTPPPPPDDSSPVDYEGEAFDQPYSFYQARFDLLNDCVAIVDPDHRILMCSRPFARLFHRSPEELLHLHYREFAAPALKTVLDGICSDLHPSDKTVGTILPLSMDQRIQWQDLNVSNASEGRSGIFIYPRPIIQTRQFLYNHLQETIERIHDHLHRLRALYHGLLSHFPPQHSLHPTLLGLAQSNEDMLDLSLAWVQANRTTWEKQTYSPQLLELKPLLDQVEEIIRLRGYPVRFGCPTDPPFPAPPIPLMADAALLKSMFMNLLKNAHQASRNGDIRLSVRTSPQQVQIDIRNDGEVPMSIRDTFFDKMVKGPESSGMGLGTYSAKLTAERHGGRLALDTAEPGYTTLHITLPLAKDAAHSSPAPSRPTPKPLHSP